MTKTSLDDRMLDRMLRVLHPVPPTQDSTCSYIKWMLEDAVHCPGVGEYKCKQQKEPVGDQYGISGFDYKPCNASDHKVCPLYLATQQQK